MSGGTAEPIRQWHSQVEHAYSITHGIRSARRKLREITGKAERRNTLSRWAIASVHGRSKDELPNLIGAVYEAVTDAKILKERAAITE
jgi:hypothetical protein